MVPNPVAHSQYAHPLERMVGERGELLPFVPSPSSNQLYVVTCYSITRETVLSFYSMLHCTYNCRVLQFVPDKIQP